MEHFCLQHKRNGSGKKCDFLKLKRGQTPLKSIVWSVPSQLPEWACKIILNQPYSVGHK